KRGSVVETSILPIGDFTLAEDYHQKFYLRQRSELEQELIKIYPKWNDFTNSTAAMRLNAYLAGHGTPKTLEKEIDRFGLSAESKKLLREFVKNFSELFGEGR